MKVKNVLKLCLISALATSVQVWALDSASAIRCEQETGIPVTDFNCEDGTVVPSELTRAPGDKVTVTTYGSGTKCDKPNMLNRECDPGSKFQVITNTLEGYSVAHCRKKGSGTNIFQDIAYIQHNNKTGATCFYQSEENADSSGTVTGLRTTTPSSLMGLATGCISCHDNGALIRSNYITQIKKGMDIIPGNADTTFNQAQNFGGNDNYFIVDNTQKRTHSIRAWNPDGTENKCTSCHTLSFWANKVDNSWSLSGAQFNTSRYDTGYYGLAYRATNLIAAAGQYAPYWMTPNTTNPNLLTGQEKLDQEAAIANNQASANRMWQCAQALKNLGTSLNSETNSIMLSDGSQCNSDRSNFKDPINENILLTNQTCLKLGSNIDANRKYVELGACVTHEDSGSYPDRWEYSPITKTFRADGQWCLDAGSNTASSQGQPLLAVRCSIESYPWGGQASDAQRWIADRLGNRFILAPPASTNAATNLCIKANSSAVGSKLTLATCSTTDSLQYASPQELSHYYFASNVVNSSSLADKAVTVVNGSVVLGGFNNDNFDKAATAWVFEKVSYQKKTTEAITGKTKTKVEFYYRIRNASNFNQMLVLNSSNNGLALSSTASDATLPKSQWILTNLPYSTTTAPGFSGKHMFMIQSKSNPSLFIKNNAGVLTVGTYAGADPVESSDANKIRWHLSRAGVFNEY